MASLPKTLQQCCLDVVCDSLSVLCYLQTSSTADQQQTKLVFKSPGFCLNSELSELLLSTLNEKGKLNDDSLSLFDRSAAVLGHVSIHNAPVTSRGLRILSGHSILQLKVTDCKDVTVSSITAGFNEWTVLNLHNLNISGTTLDDHSRFCRDVSKLRSLHTLNVSGTQFNDDDLKIVADLPSLKVLDISCTEVSEISPLRKCKDQLLSLSIHNLQLNKNPDVDKVGVVCELVHLAHLDVSSDTTRDLAIPSVNFERFRVTDYLTKYSSNPNLVSLDISGTEDLLPAILETFTKHHGMLNFLGLAMTEISEDDMFQPESSLMRARPDLKISGESSESQIMESLRRNLHRSNYLYKALFKLFRLSQGIQEPREDIIQLILPAMKLYPKFLGLQISAIGCLYHLTREDIGSQLHPAILSKCVDLTFTAMETFPEQEKLQQHALFMLDSIKIKSELNFDSFRCFKLALECVCLFDEPFMIEMAVGVCATLASELTSEQTKILGANVRNMRRLLTIVRERLVSTLLDYTLESTLIVLWGLTDECPSACGVFLSEGGLECLMKLLQLADDEDVEVQKKIVGPLSNFVEVKALRQNLMKEDFLTILMQKFSVEHDIKVTYFIATILAHLCSDKDLEWENTGQLDRIVILDKLRTVITSWGRSDADLCTYRTFRPFYDLFQCPDTPLQLLPLWSIRHICSSNTLGQRFLTLLNNEGGQEHLQRLMASDNSDPEVKGMCQDILEMLDKFTRESNKF